MPTRRPELLVDEIDALRFCQTNWKKIDTFNRVTESRPSDVFAGVTSVHSRIWSRTKYFSFCFLLLRAAVNLSTVSTLVAMQLHGQAVFGDRNSSKRIELSTGNLRICDEMGVSSGAETNYTGSPLGGQTAEHCIDFRQHRFIVFKIVTGLEFATIMFLIAVVLAFQIRFLVLGASHLPGDYPFVFIILPGMIGRFSLLAFLSFASPARIQSMFFRNELTFWTYMFARPDWVSRTTAHDIAESKPSQGISLLRRSLGIFFYMLLIIVSAESLLIKLSTVMFVNFRNSWSWSWGEWTCFIGFVNQLASISMVEEGELHHLMLYIFGGADAVWRKDEAAVCRQYFSMLANKVSYGRIRKQHGPLGAVVILAHLSHASTLQKLLLNPVQEERRALSRPLRTWVLTKAFLSEEAISFCSVVAQHKYERNALLRDLSCEIDESDDEEVGRTLLDRCTSSSPIKKDEGTEVTQCVPGKAQASRLRRGICEALQGRMTHLGGLRDDILNCCGDVSIAEGVPHSCRLQIAAEVQQLIEQSQANLNHIDVWMTQNDEVAMAELDDEAKLHSNSHIYDGSSSSE